MAIRTIRTKEDPILRKECKPVKEITDRTRILIEDMIETMYEAEGVGIAAPQVGILKQIFIVDVNPEEPEPYVFVNPQIVERSGEQTDYEGCLSVPGFQGQVTRADHVKVVAFNENMEQFELEADGFFARAIQHEYDHLIGQLYTDHVEGELIDLSKLEMAEDGEE